MKYTFLMIFMLVLVFSSKVYAVDCSVDFIAKKTVTKTGLFGTKKKSEFKSGKEFGKGKDKGECRDNALSGLLKDGWVITSEKTKIKK